MELGGRRCAGRRGPARISLRGDGSGPLLIETLSANVACSTGTPQRFSVSVRVAITVDAGKLTYSGPTDEPAQGGGADLHPTLQIAGRVLDGTTIFGFFILSGDIVPAVGAPRCHAQSQTVGFVAHCRSGCPKPLPATLFPGVGIGGGGLGMRGIARIGMTARQIRVLHPFRPSFDRPGPSGGIGAVPPSTTPPSRRGRMFREIGFTRPDGGRWIFYLKDGRADAILFGGPFGPSFGMRTEAGVVGPSTLDRFGSTRAEVRRAYPSARCVPRVAYEQHKPVSGCILLRGSVARGLMTVFLLDGPAIPGLERTVGTVFLSSCFLDRRCRLARSR